MHDPTVAARQHGREPNGKGGNDEPEQRWDEFFRFRPVRFYRSLAAEVEARDSAKAKRDYLTDMIRRAVYRVLDRRWIIPSAILAALGVVVWFCWGEDVRTTDVIIAVFTVVAGVATGLGWWAMHQQNDIMLRQMNQTDQTLAHMRNEQRPWLAISNKTNLYYARNDNEAKFEFDLTNHGKTPCSIRTALYGIAFDPDAETAKSLAKGSLAKRIANEGGVVPPGSTIPAVAVFPITWTEDQLNAMTTGKLCAIVVGRITYGYDDSDDYETGFMLGARTEDHDLIILGGAAENSMR